MPVAPRSEAMEKYAMVDVAKIIVAMLWKNRVPRSSCVQCQPNNSYPRYISALTTKDHITMPTVLRSMTAKTAHSQSEPPVVIWRSAFGGFCESEPPKRSDIVAKF